MRSLSVYANTIRILLAASQRRIRFYSRSYTTLLRRRSAMRYACVNVKHTKKEYVHF
jgi:hypothetical protein